MIQRTVLVVDDEPQIRRLLEAALARGGYRTISAATGNEALHLAATARPDAVLVDLGLPDRDGIELVAKFAAQGISVIVVSARDTTAEKIAALDLGAADFVVKPFDTDELLARLRAALRVTSREQEQSEPLAFGEVVLDLERRLIHRAGDEVRLAPKEYAVLEMLARNAGRVVTHAQLLRTVWGAAHENDVEYLRVAVLGVLAAAGFAAMVASAPPAAAKVVKGDCSLTVDGKVYLNIKKTCRIEFIDNDGSFTINTESKKPDYFAYVSMLDGGFANVSWNETKTSTHAHVLLGEDFRRKGGCWIGKRAKVCAFKA